MYNLLDSYRQSEENEVTTAELAERLGWGRMVAGRLFGYPGGIKGIADRAQAVIGANMNRTSLGGVLKLEEAPTDGVIGFRAWVLLNALGEDPGAWGVPDSVVPDGFEPERLGELLRRRATSSYADEGSDLHERALDARRKAAA